MVEKDLFVDRLGQGFPGEFDATAQLIWSAAQRDAAARGEGVVFPWAYFCAWLDWSAARPGGKESKQILDSIYEVVSTGPPMRTGEYLRPDRALIDIFTLAIGDSYRFTGLTSGVDYRWIVPNTLDARFLLNYRIAAMDVSLRDFLAEVLEALGIPFQKLFGYYWYRVGMPVYRDCNKKSKNK